MVVDAPRYHLSCYRVVTGHQSPEESAPAIDLGVMRVSSEVIRDDGMNSVDFVVLASNGRKVEAAGRDRVPDPHRGQRSILPRPILRQCSA